MQIAEKAYGPTVGAQRTQNLGLIRFAGAVRGHGRPGFVKGLEIPSIKLDIRRIFPGQNRVGLGSRCDQHCPRRKPFDRSGIDPMSFTLFPGVLLFGEGDRLGMAVAIHFYRHRGQTFGQADAFFKRLADLFVVQGIAGGIDHTLAIGNGDPAPALDQLLDFRRSAVGGRCLAFGADGPAVGQKFVSDFHFFRVPSLADGIFAAISAQGFVAA